MAEIITTIAESLIRSAVILALAGALCIILQSLSPSVTTQRIVRNDTKIDFFYWLMETTMLGLVIKLVLAVLITFIAAIGLSGLAGVEAFKNLHVAVQVLIIIILIDFAGYWLHRFFHGGKRWQFHSIHHSPKELDWISAVRFHPFEPVLVITTQYLLAAMLFGFDNKLIGVAMIIRSTYGFFVHSNLSWNLGVFRYVLCSPVFHRWHHTMIKEGIDKNFGGLFSCWDFIFGTVYLPENGKIQPHSFGVKDDVGNSFVKQLLYPFKGKPKN